MEEQKITDIMDRFIKQADANILLAEKSVESVTNSNKRWFIIAMVFIVMAGITISWTAYWYFKTSYYPTLSTESQSQPQSSSSKTEFNIKK